MRIIINELKRIALNRPEGYLDDVMRHGIVINNGKYLSIEMTDYVELCKKYKSDDDIQNKIKSSSCGCCKNKNLPPIKSQIRNVINSMKKVVRQAATLNHVFAEKDIINNRNNICHACEYYIHEKNRCAKCGCFTALKTSLITEKCPIKKW